MIYAHPKCAEFFGLEVDESAPPCSAVCELCEQVGFGLVLVPSVSRWSEELQGMRVQRQAAPEVAP